MESKLSNDTFTQLVSKLFSCNFVVIVSESAQQLSRNKFDDSFDTVLNQFSVVSKLNLTVRDLCGHNAYALNGLRFRFTDWQTLKTRPNASQNKKLQFDLISSLSPLLYSSAADQPMDTSMDSSASMPSTTPWYHKWKHLFIDTFELSEHDFIGTNFGTFFVITDQELENFKDVFATLITQVKQMSWIRWIQPDFVRYYVILSEQSLETHISLNTPKAALYRELQSIYPNSYWLQIDGQSIGGSAGSDPNEDVFCDNKTVVRYDSTDNCNHLQAFGESGDPLSVSIGPKYNVSLNERQRLSSGSDQSMTNSVQSLNLNDLSQRYLQVPKPKNLFDGLAAIIETMLKEFITKSLIPWAEKHIKILGEAIAQRKGFRRSIFSATKSLINNMSSSTVGLKAQSMSQSVIYLTEAPEMQLRKLADISMCLTLYELAYSSYYSAKKDFQSESAWLYYASACEASAVASYFTNKFQRHYFEQAINCYVDTCRAMSLATRATILATESSRHLWPNDAANLFIRMTGDDSDLRSALFLEQASKCFLSAGARQRKSAFHHVLAGHRYNRCGLKHYALHCYQQFDCQQWSAASDHVNLTIARLFISIANTNQTLCDDYRRQGLELLKANSGKQLFFQEFIREIKKDFELNANNVENTSDYHYLDVPVISTISFEPIEGTGIPQLKDRNVCFVSEEIVFKLCLKTPFPLVLHQLKFYSDNPNAICPTITSTLDSTEETIIYLSVVPEIECDFQLLGLEYKCDDCIDIRVGMTDKLMDRLKFRAIKSLPSILVDIGFESPVITGSALGLQSIQVFANEIIDLYIRLSSAQNEWKPASVLLTTNAMLTSDGLEVLTDMKEIALQFDSYNRFKIKMPSDLGENSLYFRLTYTEDKDNQRSRVLTKTILFDVTECLRLDNCVDSVVSLTNVLNSESVFVQPFAGQSIAIPAALTAHVLCESSTIPWTMTSARYGLISL